MIRWVTGLNNNRKILTHIGPDTADGLGDEPHPVVKLHENEEPQNVHDNADGVEKLVERKHPGQLREEVAGVVDRLVRITVILSGGDDPIAHLRDNREPCHNVAKVHDLSEHVD